MLDQDHANGVILWLLVAAVLVSIEVWFVSRKYLRASYFYFIFLPLSITAANLVFFMVVSLPLIETWAAKLFASVGATVLIMVPIFVALLIRKIALGSLDPKK